MASEGSLASGTTCTTARA